MINWNIILYWTLPGIFNSTLVSAAAALGVGGVIGLIAGAISHRFKLAVLSGIAGSFLGTMLIAMLPILSQPNLFGSGYGGIVLMFFAMTLIPIGSISGALAGLLAGFKLSPRRRQKLFLILLICIYTLIALASYGRKFLACAEFPGDLYCRNPYL